MKALIIIDMQEAYVGQSRNLKRHPYDADGLIKNINSKIADYKQRGDTVIYIKNKGKLADVSGFVKGLDVASDLCFTKARASCFSNTELISYLEDYSISELELVGVDGNYCIGMSATQGANKGYRIYVALSCVGVGNQDRFQLTKDKMLKAGVELCEY